MSVRFATMVVLRSHETFDALEACAIAERALLRCGRVAEAALVAGLFELLEDRVTLDPGQLSVTGSNSSDNEFTQ